MAQSSYSGFDREVLNQQASYWRAAFNFSSDFNIQGENGVDYKTSLGLVFH